MKHISVIWHTLQILWRMQTADSAGRSCDPVTFRRLFDTGRPTTGLYAFVVCFHGFGWTYWNVSLLVSVVVGLMMMSAMTFNDYIDRHHDRKKGKVFVSDHADVVRKFWLASALLISFLVIVLFTITPSVALFCFTLWVVALVYSFVPNWFVVQNMIVAFCSGCPVLCGMIYAGVWQKESFAVFAIFACLVWYNEVAMDIEDRDSDFGYKDTLPVRLGPLTTARILFCSIPIVTLPYFFHPNVLMMGVGIGALFYLAQQQLRMISDLTKVRCPQDAIWNIAKVTLLLMFLDDVWPSV